MDTISTRNFGLLIAYVIPGFVCLLGAGSMSDAVWVWLVGAGSGGPSVGGVLYVGIASVGAGMTSSVVRWAVLDSVHDATGIDRPDLDESRLTERLEAFDYLVEQHYRYYQFYGNTLVATAAAYAMWRCSPHSVGVTAGWAEVMLLVIGAVFAAGSRDALRKYYSGSILLLGTMQKEIDDDEWKAPPCPQQAGPAEARGQDGSGDDVVEGGIESGPEAGHRREEVLSALTNTGHRRP